jgi:thioredoxin 1
MQTDSVPTALVAEVNELNFDAEVLKHRGPVLVDFSTTWCGPCRALSPIVHELARERAGSLKVVAIDGDAAPNLTARYGVRGFPTVIVFRSGEEVARRLGLTTKKKLLELLATE